MSARATGCAVLLGALSMGVVALAQGAPPPPEPLPSAPPSAPVVEPAPESSSAATAPAPEPAPPPGSAPALAAPVPGPPPDFAAPAPGPPSAYAAAAPGPPPAYAAAAPGPAPAWTLSPDDSEPEVGWYAGERGFSMRAVVGGGYRHLGTIPAGIAQLEVAVGALTDTGAWYGVLGTELGRTEHGLLFGGLVSLGGQWEAPAGPAHLGVGFRITPSTMFKRFTVTGLDHAISEISAALVGSAMFDVVKSDSVAFVLGVQASAAAMGRRSERTQFVPGVTGLVGVRYF